MFGTSNNDLREEILELKEILINNTERLIEVKLMMLEVQKSTLVNRAAIIKEKNPTREVIKEVIVNRARKKPRPRIRETQGGKKITEAEINEFVQLFDQGLNYTEISGMTGRSASAVSNKIYKRKKALEEI